MLHKDENQDDWYFVHPMAGALQRFAERFHFDFQTPPVSAVVVTIPGR
jgi:hypothetical protein